MSDETDAEWRFTSTYEDADAIRVEVTVWVPRRMAWTRVTDAGEIAQMAAANAIKMIHKHRDDAMNEVPF